MWELIKSGPDILKSWREHGTELYRFLAGFAAILVVTACFTGLRPSDVLVEFARFLGLAPVAQWVTEDAPPFVTTSSPAVRMVALVAVSLVVISTFVVPVLRLDGWGPRDLRWQMNSVLGSRSTSTVWVLLLVAKQQGEIGSFLDGWCQVSGTVSLTLVGIGMVGLLVTAIAEACHRERVVAFLMDHPWTFYSRTCAGFFATHCAVLIAAIWPVASLAGWFGAVTNDRYRRA